MVDLSSILYPDNKYQFENIPICNKNSPIHGPAYIICGPQGTMFPYPDVKLINNDLTYFYSAFVGDFITICKITENSRKDSVGYLSQQL